MQHNNITSDNQITVDAVQNHYVLVVSTDSDIFSSISWCGLFAEWKIDCKAIGFDCEKGQSFFWDFGLLDLNSMWYSLWPVYTDNY